MASKDERRRLKAAYKRGERAKARQLLILDEVGAAEVCDKSLRLTRAWAIDNGIDADALDRSLSNFGANCDCEVLANVDPDAIF